MYLNDTQPSQLLPKYFMFKQWKLTTETTAKYHNQGKY